MFSTQDVITALAVGLFVGWFAGAVCWEILVTAGWRGKAFASRKRADRLQMRAYSEEARRAAFTAMRDAIGKAHPEVLDGNGDWSRKVTPLRRMKP